MTLNSAFHFLVLPLSCFLVISIVNIVVIHTVGHRIWNVFVHKYLSLLPGCAGRAPIGSLGEFPSHHLVTSVRYH